MHIAITGKLGSGKSTVAKLLSEKLGFEVYSTGSVQRSAAEDMGLTTLELNEKMKTDPSLDYIIDDTVEKLSLERDDLIFDSRMAWHFAHNSFRVFITVDPMEAARRVFSAERGDVEKYSTAEEAESALQSRGGLERERFLKIYGVDYLDPKNYDIVIDSTGKTPDEVASLIIEAYTLHSEKKSSNVYTENAPAAIGPYSQAVKLGNIVFTSGQIPIDPKTGKIEADGIKAQTEQVCKNLEAVLEAAGSSLEKVVKTLCFLSDMADFAEFNEVYAKYFKSKPARSCVAVKDLPKNALVEVEVVAEI